MTRTCPLRCPPRVLCDARRCERLEPVRFHHPGEPWKGRLDEVEHLEAGGAVERSTQHLGRLPDGEGEMERPVGLPPCEHSGEELRDPVEFAPLRGPAGEVFDRQVDRKVAEQDEVLLLAQGDVVEMEMGEGGEGLAPRRSQREKRLDPGEVPVHRLVEQGEEDPVLAAEVVVERPLRHPGIVGDLRGRGLAVPLLREEAGRGGEDRPAPGGGRHRPVPSPSVIGPRSGPPGAPAAGAGAGAAGRTPSSPTG